MAGTCTNFAGVSIHGDGITNSSYAGCRYECMVANRQTEHLSHRAKVIDELIDANLAQSPNAESVSAYKN